MSSKINSLKDAFVAVGLDPDVRPDVSMFPEAFQKSIIADLEAEVLTKALNNENQDKEWVPDHDDRSQPKYEHWYIKKASGWALGGVCVWDTVTICGARRAFRTREIAHDAWNRFPEVYINQIRYHEFKN